MYKSRKDYFKKHGAKSTIVSEIFKENELNGKSVTETEVELLSEKIVKSRMLNHYRKTYDKTKTEIGWM